MLDNVYNVVDDMCAICIQCNASRLASWEDAMRSEAVHLVGYFFKKRIYYVHLCVSDDKSGGAG